MGSKLLSNIANTPSVVSQQTYTMEARIKEMCDRNCIKTICIFTKCGSV